MVKYFIICALFFAFVLSETESSFIDIEELMNYYPQFINDKVFELDNSIYVMVTKDLTELMDTKRWTRNSARVIENETRKLRMYAVTRLRKYIESPCDRQYERTKEENPGRNVSMSTSSYSMDLTGRVEKLISKRYSHLLIEAYKYIKNETWDNDYVCNINVRN